MAANYKISVQSSGTWIVPSGAPGPDTPGDLVYTIDGINGNGLIANNPSQNITGTITLDWIPATAPVQAKITITKDVLFNTDRSKLQQAWEQLLANLDAQEANNYMRPAGARTTASLLGQNMPMLLAEIAYYRLRFSPASVNHYIDLQPGMRLLIVYGNYYDQSHSGTGQQSKNFSATGMSIADIQTEPGGRGLTFNSFMALQKTAVQAPLNIPAGNVQVASGMIDLAGQPTKSYHRLFYPQGDFVASNTASLSVTNSVCLVSTYCYGSLGTAPNTAPLQESCNPLYPRVYPTVFFGRCNLVVQIPVTVNGTSTYVFAGSTLGNILETTLAAESQPRMLKLIRYLNGQKATVIFPSANPTAALNMPVLQGDAISWLPMGDFQLLERVQAIYRITTPPPDATTLCRLTIQSFGNIAVYDLPGADDMALALLESHDQPSSYTSTDIGKALFSVYNTTPFTDPYTGPQLTYSLYFAGFDPINVSIGVVGSYTPVITLETGGTLVNFLLASGAGYSVREVSKGVYVSLANSQPANAYYLVKDLVEGSLTFGQSYTPGQVAEGTYQAIGYQVDTAYQLAAALMQGSSLAAPAKQEYPATVTGPALYYAYTTGDLTLNQDNLASALAKPFFGQALGYPVDQVALGVFAVYPLSDATTIAHALLSSGVGYSMNDVAKGTYAIKNYLPVPLHALSPWELADALHRAYGSDPVNTPKSVAIALVYAIANVTPNEVAAAVAKAFGYLDSPYVQDHINTISSALVAAFSFSGTTQTDVNKIAAALLYAFTQVTATQNAIALVAGFQFPASGTNLSGMSAVSTAIVAAFAYSKDNQTQVNGTAAALQQAFTVNMQDQPSASTLGKSLVAGFGNIDALILMTALVTTGSYVKSKQGDITLAIQATATALQLLATNQTQINTLIAAAKTSLALDGQQQNDASYTSRSITNINGTAVPVLVNTTALQNTFAYAGTKQQDINLLANAVVYGYSFSGNIQSNVNDLTGAIAQVFSFDKHNTTQVTATATAQIAAFGFQVSSQANINTSTLALVSTFNYPGYGDRTYLKSDALFIAGVLQTVFNGITIQQMLPALRSGFVSFLPVDAGTILTALYKLNTSSSTDIALLGNLAGTSYQLTTAPYGVASVSLVLFAPSFTYLACSSWIGKWYTGWNAADFQIFNNVFNTNIWAQALSLVNGRQTPNNIATTLQQAYDQNHSMADEMVRILAACYYYLDLSVAMVPVATAMKQSGYTLVQTSGAMGNGQYKTQWNATYYQQLVNIYNS